MDSNAGSATEAPTSDDSDGGLGDDFLGLEPLGDLPSADAAAVAFTTSVLVVHEATAPAPLPVCAELRVILEYKHLGAVASATSTVSQEVAARSKACRAQGFTAREWGVTHCYERRGR